MLSYDVPVLEEYYTLHQLLLTTSFYQPIFFYDLAPWERYDRRKWLSGIQLPFPIMLYRFAYGNHLGTLCYAWKIPDDKSVDNAAVVMFIVNSQKNNLLTLPEQCVGNFWIAIQP